jgi:hypothetical protein
VRRAPHERRASHRTATTVGSALSAPEPSNARRPAHVLAHDTPTTGTRDDGLRMRALTNVSVAVTGLGAALVALDLLVLETGATGPYERAPMDFSGRSDRPAATRLVAMKRRIGSAGLTALERRSTSRGTRLRPCATPRARHHHPADGSAVPGKTGKVDRERPASDRLPSVG